MMFNLFLERAFCLMVLGLTIYCVRVESIKVNENKENLLMTLEDYRIPFPLFVGEDGVTLVFGQKPALVIADEYLEEERCKIQDKPKPTEKSTKNWFLDWLQIMEYIE